MFPPDNFDADDFEEFGEPHEAKLPDGVEPEQVEALIRDISERLEKVGLYALPMVTAGSDPESGDELHIFMSFDIGKLAFVDRVQNPEQHQFDETFNRMAHDEAHQRAEDIRNRFREGKDDGQQSSES